MKIVLRNGLITVDGDSPEDLLRLKAALIEFKLQDNKKRVALPPGISGRITELLYLLKAYDVVNIDEILEASISQPYRVYSCATK